MTYSGNSHNKKYIYISPMTNVSSISMKIKDCRYLANNGRILLDEKTMKFNTIYCFNEDTFKWQTKQ